MEKVKDITENLEYLNRVKDMNLGKNLKYYILTMGCLLNENDSEKIAGMLEEMGYSKTEDVSLANIIVFNTCCIRENAEEKLFGKLGEVKKYREENGAIIAIGGCMMQEKEIIEKMKTSYRFYDIIFGTHTMHKFPEDLYKILNNKKRIEDIEYIDGEIIEGLPIKREDNIRASVTIMNGCDNFCTYCIVPYVRGRERSRRAEDIINECEELAKQGYKEIMLLGQNVNSYMRSERRKGENIGEIDSFAKLLRAIDKIEGIEKIRFTSPHPRDFTEDVIDAIKDSSKISRILHLPLQSGSTNVLKRMNRSYTKEEFLNLVDRIREKIPDIKFSTDIIVGFPGESDSDFEDTLDVVKKVRFEQVYMFIYSVRVGTPAEKMEDQIPEEIKHERFDRLKKTAEDIIDELNDTYVGKTEKVLVEGYSKNNKEIKTGRTDSNKIVNFEAPDNLIGKMVDVKITENHKWYLGGEIIKE